MKYTIDPTMTYSEAVLFYEEYLTAAKAAGKKPGIFPALYHSRTRRLFPSFFYLHQMRISVFKFVLFSS